MAGSPEGCGGSRRWPVAPEGSSCADSAQAKRSGVPGLGVPGRVLVGDGLLGCGQPAALENARHPRLQSPAAWLLWCFARQQLRHPCTCVILTRLVLKFAVAVDFVIR